VKQVYYGWYIVAMALVIFTVLIGSTFAAFGVFVIPVSAEFMLSRADMNTALIFKNLGNAVFAPVIGRVLDKVPTRPVMIVCSIIFALSFIGLGLSHSLWLGALIMFVGVPTAYLGAGSLTNTLLVARWFTAQRGRAMMLAGIGTSLGTMIGAPAAGFLVQDYGWRTALIIIGLTIGALLLLFALIVRTLPGPDDLELGSAPPTAEQIAQRDQPAPSPVGVTDLLLMPHFWTIALSTSMAFAASQAVIVSLVPFASESGLSMIKATSLVSVLGATAILGGLCASTIADKVDRVVLMSGLFILYALVNAALLLDKSYPILLACAAVLGGLSGIIVATFYALLADRFGTASFGTVRGTAFLLTGTLGMVSVRFAGEVYDRTHGYDFMFATFVASYLLAAILMFSTRFIGSRPTVVTAGPATG
jgi:predicted MFS family arabinose efflux permease